MKRGGLLDRLGSYLDQDYLRFLLILILTGFAASLAVSYSLPRFVEDPTPSPFGPTVDALFLTGGLTPARIARFEVWRLVTVAFLHANLLHLGMNCMALMSLAPLLRSVLTGFEVMTLWVVATITASITSVLYRCGDLFWDVARGTTSLAEVARTPQAFTVGIGASGAVMGVGGFLLGYTWKARDATGIRFRQQFMMWFLLNLGMGLSIPGIDNAAHIGGAIGGFLLGRFRVDGRASRVSRAFRSRKAGIASLLIIIVSIGAATIDYTLHGGVKWRAMQPYRDSLSAALNLFNSIGPEGMESKPQEFVRSLEALNAALPEPKTKDQSSIRDAIARHLDDLAGTTRSKSQLPAAGQIWSDDFNDLLLRCSESLTIRFSLVTRRRASGEGD